MPKPQPKPIDVAKVAGDARRLSKILQQIRRADLEKDESAREQFRKSGLSLVMKMGRVLGEFFPARHVRASRDTIDMTLGKAEGIAKFFAFGFISVEKQPLSLLLERDGSPFFGSGVYAIYYHGKEESAYQMISGTETPVYVGKAEPENPFAETLQAQGRTLHNRLKEHAKNIQKTNLSPGDFMFRHATIQSGMQAAIETFMIRLFNPIWNKECKICYGFGKHGDSSETRKNKRSPWDTMHPGRKWAEGTEKNQMERIEIEKRITVHFLKHPVFRDKKELLEKLSLGGA
jgi:hypothetical protein